MNVIVPTYFKPVVGETHNDSLLLYIEISVCSFPLIKYSYLVFLPTNHLPVKLGPQAEILVDSGARRGDLVVVDGEW